MLQSLRHLNTSNNNLSLFPKNINSMSFLESFDVRRCVCACVCVHVCVFVCEISQVRAPLGWSPTHAWPGLLILLV